MLFTCERHICCRFNNSSFVSLSATLAGAFERTLMFATYVGVPVNKVKFGDRIEEFTFPPFITPLPMAIDGSYKIERHFCTLHQNLGFNMIIYCTLFQSQNDFFTHHVFSRVKVHSSSVIVSTNCS